MAQQPNDDDEVERPKVKSKTIQQWESSTKNKNESNKQVSLDSTSMRQYCQRLLLWEHWLIVSNILQIANVNLHGLSFDGWIIRIEW